MMPWGTMILKRGHFPKTLWNFTVDLKIYFRQLNFWEDFSQTCPKGGAFTPNPFGTTWFDYQPLQPRIRYQGLNKFSSLALVTEREGASRENGQNLGIQPLVFLHVLGLVICSGPGHLIGLLNHYENYRFDYIIASLLCLMTSLYNQTLIFMALISY
jgi:hypothetical protein